MSKSIDYTGSKFGRLTVVALSHKRGNHKYWRCRCECGNEKLVSGTNLKNGHAKSCGCYNKELIKERNFQDLTGQKFNRLTVVEYAGIHLDKFHKWKCLCDCGNYTEVITGKLKNGHTKSCGCLKNETSIENANKNFGQQTGENHWNYKGGITPHRKADMGRKQYQDFRKAVLERDDYTCQICNKRGGNLEVHHILPYCNNQKIRYDVNNGITMCKKDHREFHNTYSYTNFGSLDLINFMSIRI